MLGLENIISSIKNVFNNKLRNPATIIPPILLICGLMRRPGLSCAISVGNIIQSLDKEGINTDKAPDGSENLVNKLVKSVTCEIVRTLKEDANIQIALAPGSVNVVSTGANAGGPITCVGSNINFVTGRALFQ